MPFDPKHHHRHSIRLVGYDYTQPGAYYVTICAARRGAIFGHRQSGSIVLNTSGQIVHDVWMTLPAHYPHVRLDAFVVMPDHVHGIIVFTDYPVISHAPVADDEHDGTRGADTHGDDRARGADAHGDDRARGADAHGDDRARGAGWVGAQRTAPLPIPPSPAPPDTVSPSPAPPDTVSLSSAPSPVSSSSAHLSGAVGPYVIPGSLAVIVRAFKSAATRLINVQRNTPGVTVWQRNYYEHIVRDDADLERIRRYIAANPSRWRA